MRQWCPFVSQKYPTRTSDTVTELSTYTYTNPLVRNFQGFVSESQQGRIVPSLLVLLIENFDCSEIVLEYDIIFSNSNKRDCSEAHYMCAHRSLLKIFRRSPQWAPTMARCTQQCCNYSSEFVSVFSVVGHAENGITWLWKCEWIFATRPILYLLVSVGKLNEAGIT